MSKIIKISKDYIRRSFANKLSEMYMGEIKEYKDFVNIVHKSNVEFIRKNPHIRVDSFSRVIEEKHGAIRIGTPEELKMISRIFSAMNMQPVNFYDLTTLKKPLPIVSTAFRAIDSKSMNISPFRMFTSMLTLDNRKFFSEDQSERAKHALSKRNIFSDDLRFLVNQSEQNGGLTAEQAEPFVDEVLKVFQMDKDQIIDFDLYEELSKVNDVAADIAAFNTIHINHLTPRAYDIYDAFGKIKAQGIPTIDEMQGPPFRDNEQALPLLNQTSRKAPGEFVYATNNLQLMQQIKEGKITLDQLHKQQKIKIIHTKDSEAKENYLKRAKV